MDYAQLASNSTKMEEFTSDVVNTTATNLNMSSSWIEVTGVTAGSVVVNMVFRFPPSAPPSMVDNVATTLSASPSAVFGSSFTSAYNISSVRASVTDPPPPPPQLSPPPPGSSSPVSRTPPMNVWTEEDKKISAGAIAGIVVGSVVGVLLAAAVVAVLVRRRVSPAAVSPRDAVEVKVAPPQHQAWQQPDQASAV